MPDWVYVAGWLFAPVAAAAASLWWHERRVGMDAQKQLVELREKHTNTVVMNAQLRRELSRVDRELADMRHAAVNHGG